MQIIIVTIKTLWYFFLLFMEKVPIGKSTNMILFPKEKVPYSTWYFFPLVLFPIHPHYHTWEKTIFLHDQGLSKNTLKKKKNVYP